MIVHVDGSSNLVSSAICFVVDEEKRFLKVVPYDESCIIEYEALLFALDNVKNALIFSDCKQMVKEIIGLKEVPTKNKNLLSKVSHLLKENNCDICWISRKKNLAGIYLEKRLNKIKADRNDTLMPIVKVKHKHGKKKFIIKKRNYQKI